MPFVRPRAGPRGPFCHLPLLLLDRAAADLARPLDLWLCQARRGDRADARQLRGHRRYGSGATAVGALRGRRGRVERWRAAARAAADQLRPRLARLAYAALRFRASSGRELAAARGRDVVHRELARGCRPGRSRSSAGSGSRPPGRSAACGRRVGVVIAPVLAQIPEQAGHDQQPLAQDRRQRVLVRRVLPQPR